MWWQHLFCWLVLFSFCLFAWLYFRRLSLGWFGCCAIPFLFNKNRKWVEMVNMIYTVFRYFFISYFCSCWADRKIFWAICGKARQVYHFHFHAIRTEFLFRRSVSSSVIRIAINTLLMPQIQMREQRDKKKRSRNEIFIYEHQWTSMISTNRHNRQHTVASSNWKWDQKLKKHTPNANNYRTR